MDSWIPYIDKLDYGALGFNNIPSGPEGVTSRILIRTPRRRWWHKPLGWLGWWKLRRWLYDRRLERECEQECDCGYDSDYRVHVIGRPADRWDHDA